MEETFTVYDGFLSSAQGQGNACKRIDGELNYSGSAEPRQRSLHAILECVIVRSQTPCRSRRDMCLG